MHDVTLSRFPGARHAAIRHVGPYAGMGAVFDRLTVWAGARGLIGPETRFLGLYHDDPTEVAEARNSAPMPASPSTRASTSAAR